MIIENNLQYLILPLFISKGECGKAILFNIYV